LFSESVSTITHVNDRSF